MDDLFRKRVRDAAIAGWWTVLIASIFVTLQWLGYLHLMHARPDWVMKVWGPDISWERIQRVYIWGVGTFKLIIWVMIMVSIWLSLWARRLRKG